MEMKKTSIHLNDLEQYGRRFNLRIFGVPLKEGDDYKETVVSLCQSSLGMDDLNKNDIENAHPLPPNKPSSSSPHSRDPPMKSTMIVRFKSRATRDDILRKRKQLKNSGISIAEDLTSCNARLLKRLHNDDSVSDSWTVNGKVYCKFKNTSKKCVVNPFDSLSDVFARFCK